MKKSFYTTTTTTTMVHSNQLQIEENNEILIINYCIIFAGVFRVLNIFMG